MQNPGVSQSSHGIQVKCMQLFSTQISYEAHKQQMLDLTEGLERKSQELRLAILYLQEDKLHMCISHYWPIPVYVPKQHIVCTPCDSGHATVTLSAVRFHGPDLMGLCNEFDEAMIFSSCLYRL